eukprot:CAMPEP_0115724166 /NCGR_PEP_ID=MMETSP0272-20121206/80634_1 /TAXON_ID=71861 /ORGANISM="Scrippsiella trochoidea, Strain CCMP3099" /LENGTH=187 /DNA_ID=CAMNT_0003167373 /DNA_START=64 /DNA_END=628 /DNA_ORIENTATION=-
MAREEDALALRNLAQHVCASNDGPGNLAHVDALADCRIFICLSLGLLEPGIPGASTTCTPVSKRNFLKKSFHPEKPDRRHCCATSASSYKYRRVQLRKTLGAQEGRPQIQWCSPCTAPHRPAPNPPAPAILSVPAAVYPPDTPTQSRSKRNLRPGLPNSSLNSYGRFPSFVERARVADGHKLSVLVA